MANKDVRIFGMIGVLLAVLAGCSKSDAPPATQPAASQPAPVGPAVLNIAGEPCEFAITQLKVKRDQESIHLLLLGSDRQVDPQSTYYFDLTVDVDEPSQLPGKVWKYKDNGVDEPDPSVGIFLAGDIRLQPAEMTVEFSGDYPRLTVELHGKFLRDGDPAKVMKADGTFSVMATEK